MTQEEKFAMLRHLSETEEPRNIWVSAERMTVKQVSEHSVGLHFLPNAQDLRLVGVYMSESEYQEHIRHGLAPTNI